MIPAEAVERFRADLETLTGGPPGKIGVAVSGGPDSLALLLLAHAAYPGGVEAATVDHGLRPESAAEAAWVGQVCADLGLTHATLTLDWPDEPEANLQSEARFGRYLALANWALDRDLPFLATGHHLDDQAETLLLRLARGSGVAGLAGTRASRALMPATDGEASVHVVRPLLRWRRAELGGIVSDAGLTAVDDPSNRDERFDRTNAREFLNSYPGLLPERLADTAVFLAEAEEALDWAARQLFSQRAVYGEGASTILDGRGLPRELQRRLLIEAFGDFKPGKPLPGPKLGRLLDSLREGSAGTLAGVRARTLPDATWHLDWAPPRKS